MSDPRLPPPAKLHFEGIDPPTPYYSETQMLALVDALQRIAKLDHGRPLIEARAIARQALRYDD